MTRKLPVLIAILVVIAIYVFTGSVGGARFRLVEWWESSYPNMSEGFLNGKVSLMEDPDPRLAALPDPYQPNARNGIPSHHDASYFRGRFFLRFTPLPSLLVYIPVRLVAGKYPSDTIVGTIFAIVAFLAHVAFIIRALRDRRPWLPVWLWILFAGLGNVTLFILLDIWMYEVAVLCGMAFSSLWAYALLRFIEKPTWLTAALVGTFLGLAIVSRPTLLVLAVVTLFALRKRSIIPFAVPLIVIGVLYGAYNYARFRSPFESGLQYQLTNVSLRDYPFCRLCTGPELGRFLNNVNQYLFRAPAVSAKFPFFVPSYNEYDPAVMFPAKHEEVIGVVAVIPLIVFGLFATLLVWKTSRTATLLTAAGWLTMFGVSTCAWMTARFELDFLPAMILGTVLAIEEFGVTMARALPLRVMTALLAVYSIVVGTLFGFTGRTEAFKRFNPELFERIAGWFR